MQTLDVVVFHWLMSPGRWVQTTNDFRKSMLTRHNLCVPDLVYIPSLRPMLHARHTYSTFIRVGLRGCCHPLVDIQRTICANSAWCLHADVCRLQTILTYYARCWQPMCVAYRHFYQDKFDYERPMCAGWGQFWRSMSNISQQLSKIQL